MVFRQRTIMPQGEGGGGGGLRGGGMEGEGG